MLSQDEIHDPESTVREFHKVVNMTPRTLENWLRTDESRQVGQKEHEGDESTGHASGRRIVAILRGRQNGHDEDDLDHMRKVIGFVHRHLAQRPSGSVVDTPWRYSLMNWGHDPLRDS